MVAWRCWNLGALWPISCLSSDYQIGVERKELFFRLYVARQQAHRALHLDCSPRYRMSRFAMRRRLSDDSPATIKSMSDLVASAFGSGWGWALALILGGALKNYVVSLAACISLLPECSQRARVDTVPLVNLVGIVATARSLRIAGLDSEQER